MSNKLANGRFLSIDEMFVFIVTEDGGEGIMGMRTPGGEWMPFIGADLARVDSLKVIADKIGIPYEIRYFKKCTTPNT